MSDDVKTLRWAAEMFNREQPLANEEWAKVMHLLCRHTADAIEREEAKATQTLGGIPVVQSNLVPPNAIAFVHDGKLVGGIKDIMDEVMGVYDEVQAVKAENAALQAAEDRGWNAALDAVHAQFFGFGDITHISFSDWKKALASLRRGASS